MCAPPDHAPLDMAGLAATQGAFAEALLRGGGSAQDRRFAVYRNNVRASLVAAVAARFPVIVRLVGQEFFDAMALVFVSHHPPTSPVIAEYGAAFAGFLEDFEPAAELPYLADVARLEWLRQQAFHAADGDVLGIDRLATIAPNRLDSLGLALHPATAIVASPWPILSIWTTNTQDEVTRPIGAGLPGEAVLVTRPGLDVFANALPPCGELFVGELACGGTLGKAAAVAANVDGSFDLATTLAILFRAGAVSGLIDGASP